MSRKRLAGIIAGSVAGLLLPAFVSGVLIVRSTWFYEKIRRAMIETIETATGGRAEVGSFEFDWKRLRVEVKQFVLHGTESADKPPLFRAASVTVGLKILSVLHRDVDVQSLDVHDPRIYLIIYPGGRTNVPEPKVKPRGARTALETLLDLKVGRFNIENGVFEMESRGAMPFAATGRSLALRLGYDALVPRYQGTIAMSPFELAWNGRKAIPFGVNMQLSLERNRIVI